MINLDELQRLVYSQPDDALCNYPAGKIRAMIAELRAGREMRKACVAAYNTIAELLNDVRNMRFAVGELDRESHHTARRDLYDAVSTYDKAVKG